MDGIDIIDSAHEVDERLEAIAEALSDTELAARVQEVGATWRELLYPISKDARGKGRRREHAKRRGWSRKRNHAPDQHDESTSAPNRSAGHDAAPQP